MPRARAGVQEGWSLRRAAVRRGLGSPGQAGSWGREAEPLRGRGRSGSGSAPGAASETAVVWGAQGGLCSELCRGRSRPREKAKGVAATRGSGSCLEKGSRAVRSRERRWGSSKEISPFLLASGWTERKLLQSPPAAPRAQVLRDTPALRRLGRRASPHAPPCLTSARPGHPSPCRSRPESGSPCPTRRLSGALQPREAPASVELGLSSPGAGPRHARGGDAAQTRLPAPPAAFGPAAHLQLPAWPLSPASRAPPRRALG